MTEGIGATAIRGDEWLAHPGSVGRTTFSDVRILDAEGNDLPTGQVGEIFLRLKGPSPRPTIHRLAPARGLPPTASHHGRPRLAWTTSATSSSPTAGWT
ncbi:MAG: hypothetical protein U0232_02415 [Thermomicrobiales bacterium]